MAADVDQVTFGKVTENVAGKLFEKIVPVTLSTGYPNAGLTLGYSFPVQLATRYGQPGIRTLVGVNQVANNTAGKTYTAQWDSEAGKLHVFTGGAEVADGTDLSTITLTLKLTGTR